jgi:hypothetical protein
LCFPLLLFSSSSYCRFWETLFLNDIQGPLCSSCQGDRLSIVRFQKRVVLTKFDSYIFINKRLFSSRTRLLPSLNTAVKRLLNLHQANSHHQPNIDNKTGVTEIYIWWYQSMFVSKLVWTREDVKPVNETLHVEIISITAMKRVDSRFLTTRQRNM